MAIRLLVFKNDSVPLWRPLIDREEKFLMKVVYIGTDDWLAETLVNRMGQEGNDVYLLSDTAFPKKTNGISLHRSYRSPRRGKSFGKLLRSLSPDCVIFAGKNYINDDNEEESDEDVTLLARSLRAAAAFPQAKFILLSSTEVYGNSGETADGSADESARTAAVSERGIRFLREEQLLEIYRKRYAMDTVILRASQLYANRCAEGEGGFLNRIFDAAVQGKDSMADEVFQPLHASDLANAVKRVADGGTRRTNRIFNVCGNARVSARRLYQLACRQEAVQEQDVRWVAPASVTTVDSGLIRRKLGWNAHRNLEKQLTGGEITYERTVAEARKKYWKKETGLLPRPVRQTAENLLLFAAFLALQRLCSSHDLFSLVDWMLVYVILVSVSYNTFQSAFAALLAGGAYLYTQGLGVLTMGTSYSYANNVMTVMEFVSLGFVVSYTASMLREENRSVRRDLEMLQEEYEDLKAVNEENVLIKNEYEERLLATKTGFPKLYSLVSRLMVQEPDRILMETMQVISELVHTDTVAVYKGEPGSPWLRLMGELSDGSAMGGKTWNISVSPRIYDAVTRGELYQGEFGSGEPAVVLPVVCRGVPQAVLLIRTLPYESETLYHINLLKTMSLLLRDVMEEALEYEELSREERYVEGTDILKPEAFHKRLLLAREEAEKHVAEYCVVELLYPGHLADAAEMAGHTLRVTDCLGLDKEGKLFALLNNTSPESLGHLRGRLQACGLKASLVPDRPETLWA